MSIREVAVTDAEAVARLSGELGYPVSVEAMQNRIAALQGVPDHVVFVLCIGKSVIGWIDVGIVQHLQTGRHAEIGGLIVSDEYRSRGIGRRLLAHAERWIAARRITHVVVRSRTTREAAHRFYLREGYSHTKTSAVFSKDLPALL